MSITSVTNNAGNVIGHLFKRHVSDPIEHDLEYGDIVRNIYTGQFGIYDNDCEDPYDFPGSPTYSGNPQPVAFIWIPSEYGNSTDHWNWHQVEYIMRSDNPSVDCAILNLDGLV